MWGKTAAKFKQSISVIMESVPDEIFTDWYSHSMSVKSHMTYLEQHDYKWYNSSSIDITICELIKMQYNNTKDLNE